MSEQFLRDVLEERATFTAKHQRHIDGCGRCADLFDQVMSGALQLVGRQGAFDESVPTHLSEQQMLLFYDHGSTHSESEPIIEHLADCSHCRLSFLDLEKELDDYYAGVDLPAEIDEARAQQRWQELEELLAPQPNGHKTVWQRIVQVVRNGSTRGHGDAGTRGKETARAGWVLGFAAATVLLIAGVMYWRGGERREPVVVKRPSGNINQGSRERKGNETEQPTVRTRHPSIKQPSHQSTEPPSHRNIPPQRSEPAPRLRSGQAEPVYVQNNPVHHDRVGTFVGVTGTPTIRALEDKSGRRLKPQEGVYTASLIETGDTDKAEIRFDDGTTLRLDFNTTLEIPTTQPSNSRPTEVKLLLGSIWTKVQKLGPESKFEVSTPVATAAVRGTEFGLKVQLVTNREKKIEDRGSQENPQSSIRNPRSSDLEAVLTVREGKVEFFNDFGRVEVTANTESEATIDRAPTEPKRLVTLKIHNIAIPSALVWTTKTTRLQFPGATDRLVYPQGWSGMSVKDVARETLDQVLSHDGPSTAPRQVRVVRVVRSSPAEAAGIHVGDVITGMNGSPVDNAQEVNAAIFANPNMQFLFSLTRLEQTRMVRLKTTRTLDAPPMPRLSSRDANSLKQATAMLIAGKTKESQRALQTLIQGHRGIIAAAHNNLGVAYELEDDMSRAIRHYQEAAKDSTQGLYHFNLGMALRDIGNLERAREELETAMQLAPKWTAPSMWLADVLVLLDRNDEAVRVIDKAVKLKSNSPDVWMRKSSILFKVNRIGEARKAALQAIELEPTYAVAHRMVGITYMAMADEEEEDKWFRAAIELDPGDAAAYYDLAIHHKSPERERLLRRVLELNPNHGNAYSILGDIYMGRHQLGEAETYYRKAMETNPAEAAYFLDLYSLFHERGQPDEAEAMFRKTEERLIPNARMYIHMGDAYRERGKLGKAAEMYLLSIELNPIPNWMKAHGKLIELLSTRGRDDETDKLWSRLEKSLRRAIELDPNNTSALLGLAGLYSARGELDRAEEIHLKRIESNPSGGTYRNAGVFYQYMRNQLDRAEKMYLKAIELDPSGSNIGSYCELSNVYRIREQWTEAETTVRKALEVNPIALVHFTAAWLYRDLQQFDEADKMYRKAMDLNPQDDWYQRHFLFAGHYFRERGQFELAERAYRRARELNPSGITGTGIIWVLADQPDHREEALAQAIGQTEAQPKDLAAWLTLGYVRLQREELEDAATALRKAIEIGGDTTSSGEPWSYLAVVYEKRGQPQEAIQAYRKALSLYSDQPKSRAALRRLEVAQ